MQKQGAVCEMRGYMEERLQVGVIASTHGVHGEVKIFPTTDDVRRFKKLKEVILDTGKENRILEIESVKFFKQFAILKFRNRYDRRGGKIPEKEPVCDAGKCGAPTEGRIFYRRSDRREGIG